jgi:hypothetical protein
MRQHLDALQGSKNDTPDADSSSTDNTLQARTVAKAAAAAQASTAASIASGVLFQCDQAERKCKLGRLARSPVSITFYVPAPAGEKEEYGEEAEDEMQSQQQPPKGISREAFVALAQTSPEAVITQVSPSVG